MKEKIIKGLKRFYKSYIWLVIILLVIDIVTKNIILSFHAEAGTVIADWGFVHISYVENPNAAFGLGASNPTVSRIVYLIVASLACIGIATFLIWKRKQTKIYIRACLIMIMTGAIGNMIDRIFYSQSNYCVVDWIDFYWFWRYVFNIADSCIVVAAFMLIGYIIYTEVKEMIAKRKAEPAEKVILSKSEKERLEEEKIDHTDDTK